MKEYPKFIYQTKRTPGPKELREQEYDELRREFLLAIAPIGLESTGRIAALTLAGGFSSAQVDSKESADNVMTTTTTPVRRLKEGAAHESREAVTRPLGQAKGQELLEWDGGAQSHEQAVWGRTSYPMR